MPFVLFLPAFWPTNLTKEKENVHRVGIVDGLATPEAKTLMAMAMQLDSLGAVTPKKKKRKPSKDRGQGKSFGGSQTQSTTPKKAPGESKHKSHKESKETKAPATTMEDPPKNSKPNSQDSSRDGKRKSHDPNSSHGLSDDEGSKKIRSQKNSGQGEKSQLSSLDTPCSPTSALLDYKRLGNCVAQAFLAVTRLSKAIKDSHNVKIVESLRAKQKLKSTTAEAVEACSADIQDAKSHADV